MSENSVLVSYQNVNIYHDRAIALADVSFDIQEGEFLYLIGRTGSGKSSLIRTFYAEIPVTEGEASICGFDLKNLSGSDIPFLRRKLGIIFQDFQLLNNQTAFENLDFVLRATGWENKQSREARIAEVLTEVGLADKTLQYPQRMSGGEQQRLVIARAMLNNPSLIIADEPTGNLDPDTSDEIMKILITINREHNTAIIMATHNYQLIDRNPARILKVEDKSVLTEKGIVINRPAS